MEAIDDPAEAERLIQWVSEVRTICGEQENLREADPAIGVLLAKAPADENDVWPCKAARNIVERCAREYLEECLEVGVWNTRRHRKNGPVGRRSCLNKRKAGPCRGSSTSRLEL